MPTILTQAEADYNEAFNAYTAARVDFYAGKVTPAEFIALRNAMESAMKVWEAEREAV